MQQVGKRIMRQSLILVRLCPLRYRRAAHLRGRNQKLDVIFIGHFWWVHFAFYSFISNYVTPIYINFLDLAKFLKKFGFMKILLRIIMKPLTIPINLLKDILAHREKPLYNLKLDTFIISPVLDTVN